jgi:hypothetical protein
VQADIRRYLDTSRLLSVLCTPARAFLNPTQSGAAGESLVFVTLQRSLHQFHGAVYRRMQRLLFMQT